MAQLIPLKQIANINDLITGLTGSVDLTGADVIIGKFSGSFTGSFRGDGSNLTGIPTTLYTVGQSGSGSVDLLTEQLYIIGGVGINTTVSGSTLTIAGVDASNSSKGIAMYDSDTFTVSNGVVYAKPFSIGAGSGLTGGGLISLGGSVTLHVGAGVGINVNSNDVALKNGTNFSANSLLYWSASGEFANSNILHTSGGIIVQGNTKVNGNLDVNGQLTYLNVENLYIKDKYVLLNSGSANPDEGGILIDEGNATGHAFIFESDKLRWGFNSALDSTVTTADTTAYAAAVVDLTNPSHTDTSEYQKAGNIKIDADGDIWIWA